MIFYSVLDLIRFWEKLFEIYQHWSWEIKPSYCTLYNFLGADKEVTENSKKKDYFIGGSC